MNPTYRQSRFGAFLYHQRLTAFKWLAHGFSLRSSPDGSLQNLAFNDGQSRELVQRNREKFMRGVWASAAPATLELGVAEPEETKVAAPRLVTLRQCHSDTVYALNAQPPEELAMEGDGLVTDQSGLLLSVLTADCMPILIADTEKQVVAAIHAGWRGTAKRIVEKALTLMEARFSSDPWNCVAVIGPAIRSCCYQVGQEVIETFQQEFEYADRLLQKDPNSGCYLDLPTAARFQLVHAGLAESNVFSNPPCTACNLDQFFSHRGEQGKAGRMMGAIGIVRTG